MRLPSTSEGRFDVLRKCEPLTDSRVLFDQARVLNKRRSVFVTVLPEKTTTFFTRFLKAYSPEFWDVFAVMPKSCDSSFIARVRAYKAQPYFYPVKYCGNLHNIRKWIESENTGAEPYILSDDDCHSPKLYFVDDNARSGARSRVVDAEFHLFLWNLAIYHGQKAVCCYSGLNGSTQRRSSALSKRNHAALCHLPFRYNVVLTGATAVLNKRRWLVPSAYQRIRQEYSVASIQAISGPWNGTFMYMPAVLPFDVNPPKNAEAERILLKAWHPEMVSTKNMARGKAGEKKGCIIQLDTGVSSTNPLTEEELHERTAAAIAEE